MTNDTPSSEEVSAERVERLAALVRSLAAANQSLRATMSSDEFHRTIERMAEQQLIYEEFGREPR